MKKVNSGEKYKNTFNNYIVTVNSVIPKGRGFQVCFIRDGEPYGLITSQTMFLKTFELVTQK